MNKPMALVHNEEDGCKDRGASLFFSEVPQLGSLRHVLTQKTDLEKKKKMLPGKKSHGLCIHHEKIMQKQMASFFLFRQFWIKEPAPVI